MKTMSLWFKATFVCTLYYLADAAVPSSLPSFSPTISVVPSTVPTIVPNPAPSRMPTLSPTPSPTLLPTSSPTIPPSFQPSLPPTLQPTPTPSLTPTPLPTIKPSPLPTPTPSLTPTTLPTIKPSPLPTPTPSLTPTPLPTLNPTTLPTMKPSPLPTPTPSLTPTPLPTMKPSPLPTSTPSLTPTPLPTMKPSPLPTPAPSLTPTPLPTIKPSPLPTPTPSLTPTPLPTMKPSPLPTPTPSLTPTLLPTIKPSPLPTPAPSLTPTPLPTLSPTSLPTLTPTPGPTATPTPAPTPEPTIVPTPAPSTSPTPIPTGAPTLPPSSLPTIIPTPAPSYLPTLIPTLSLLPSSSPTPHPTPVPTSLPSLSPTPQPSPSPTPSPSSSPTPLPTPLPSPLPTLPPSPLPTPLPTPIPSPLPTPLPSLFPTPLPTTLPTLVPTSHPTLLPSVSLLPTSIPFPIPTPVPTAAPTGSNFPTQLPTLLPSPVPTSSPTELCVSGQYYDGITCYNCPIGYYSDTNGSAPFPSSCTLCPAGQYSVQVAAPSCTQCASGKLSSADRTFCEDCQPGQYDNEVACINCEFGKYAPSAQSGSCLTCQAGFQTNNKTASTSCISCSAGYYSKGSTDVCLDCPKGTFSAYSAPSCSNCSVGTYSNETAASSCSFCAAGTYNALKGSEVCDKCSIGKHQPASGQTLCVDCSSGKFSDEEGALACDICPIAYSSGPGSDSCEKAAFGYYLRTAGDSRTCPDHAECSGGSHGPAPLEGYWVDRASYSYAQYLYKCPRDTCKGSASNATCWLRSHYNASQCDADLLQCRTGAYGPLCGSCGAGYIYRGEKGFCEKCEEVSQSISPILIIMGLCIAAALLVFRYRKERIVRSNSVVQFLESFDSGSLKVIWVNSQIVMSIGWNLEIQFPSPFSGMLSFLSIFTLDFLSLECSVKGQKEERYFNTVYLWCCIPIIIATVIFITGVMRVVFANISAENIKEFQHRVINQHVWMFLLLTYLVLPPVANKQLQSLDCIPLQHSGDSFLRSDTAIDCGSEDYEDFAIVVSFFIALYQLIPVIWLTALYRVRQDLNPQTLTSHDKKLALFVRDKNPALAPLRFLFIDYTCDKWWFEVVDMYRRIIFIGILPLTSSDPGKRASLGVVLSIMSVAYFREEQPYRINFTNFIAYAAQYAILITYYAALSIDTGVLVDFGLKDLGMGLFLVACNLTIFILSMWLGYSRYIREKRKRNIRHAKAGRSEDAQNFSREKFNTTFHAISQTSIPTSHVLAFHYTSSRIAKMSRESGIPAMKKYGGIPLTLRRPHSTNENDLHVFQSLHPSTGQPISCGNFPNDTVLAIAFPKRLLENLPQYEEDEYLCLISVNVLSAMRPLTFDDVVNRKPWDDGLVLLPPTCISRCFKLYDNPAANELKHIDKHSTWYFENDVEIQNRSSMATSDPPKLIHQSSLESEDGSSSPSASLSLTSQKKERPMFMRSSESISNGLNNKTGGAIGDSAFDTRIVKLHTVSDYINHIKKIRKEAASRGIVPLYHYTSELVAPLVMRGGFRMSTQGQGDGGVYFSTLGPASYGLGTSAYEQNIIKDCFGVERLHEYKGLGKLDVIIIYGCEPYTLQQAPGGRDNAKMVARTLFQDLSLASIDGNYFLRPDRILGVFKVDCANAPFLGPTAARGIEEEKINDEIVAEDLGKVEDVMKQNAERIAQCVTNISRTDEHVSDDDNDEEGGYQPRGIFAFARRATTRGLSHHRGASRHHTGGENGGDSEKDVEMLNLGGKRKSLFPVFLKQGNESKDAYSTDKEKEKGKRKSMFPMLFTAANRNSENEPSSNELRVSNDSSGGGDGSNSGGGGGGGSFLSQFFNMQQSGRDSRVSFGGGDKNTAKEKEEDAIRETFSSSTKVLFDFGGETDTPHLLKTVEPSIIVKEKEEQNIPSSKVTSKEQAYKSSMLKTRVQIANQHKEKVHGGTSNPPSASGEPLKSALKGSRSSGRSSEFLKPKVRAHTEEFMDELSMAPTRVSDLNLNLENIYDGQNQEERTTTTTNSHFDETRMSNSGGGGGGGGDRGGGVRFMSDPPAPFLEELLEQTDDLDDGSYNYTNYRQTTSQRQPRRSTKDLKKSVVFGLNEVHGSFDFGSEDATMETTNPISRADSTGSSEPPSPLLVSSEHITNRTSSPNAEGNEVENETGSSDV